MRIVHISVKDLFGIFNHEISLNLLDRITIIHGPNGLGKTVLLTMLKALFAGTYPIFRRIPFAEFAVKFDDGRELNLKKKAAPESPDIRPNKRADELTLELKKYSTRLGSFTIKPMQDLRVDFPLEMVERVIPGMERVGQVSWLYHQTQETLTIEEIAERFGDRLPTRRIQRQPEPAWLVGIRRSVSIRFVETQRLLALARPRRAREFEDEENSATGAMVPSVKNYSEELAVMIQAKLAQYATLSQSLDRSFPNRLVKGAGALHPTSDALRAELNALEEKRARLEVAGLLDREQIDFTEFQNIDEGNLHVLSVYIDDVKRKLAVFDELTNKIDLLIQIVNNRFLYKRMSISQKRGFVFTAENGKRVPTSSLSSGEQHELVLFYELLFKVTPNSLILIDEPELSLHIVWQQLFLEDLQNITKLTGFDILIATHSPQIIHDRWDLTVQLQGPPNA